jgi:hypothetical protein
MGQQFADKAMQDQQRNRLMGLLSDNAPESVNGAPAVGPTRPGILNEAHPMQQELAKSMVASGDLRGVTNMLGLGGSKGGFQKGETNLMKDSKGNLFVQGSKFDSQSGVMTPIIEPVIPGVKVDPNDPPVLVGGQYGFRPSEAIKFTGEKKSEELKQANIRKAEQDAIKAYENTQMQMGRYDEAIAALDEGAGTGPIESMFPTFRASTARLEAVGNQLALGILSTVSMGALSEKELSMLQATALPKMDEPELREWLLGRKAAEQKLANLYLEAAQAYGRKMSPTEFYEMKKAQYGGGKGGDSGEERVTKGGITYTVK